MVLKNVEEKTIKMIILSTMYFWKWNSYNQNKIASSDGTCIKTQECYEN